MKRYKRVYIVRIYERSLCTTRLRDVFSFLSKELLSCVRGFYRVEFEVFRYE